MCTGEYQKGSLTHVPARFYLAFDNAPNLDALKRKLAEFNATVLQQQGAGVGCSEAEASRWLE